MKNTRIIKIKEEMQENKGKVFMAFAQGSESTEGAPVKRYIGVGSVFVKAVNPTKTEMEKLYGRDIENEPTYVSKGKAGFSEDSPEVDQVRLDFILQTDPEKNNGIDMISKATFFLKAGNRFNKDNTKIQVVNKYGEFTWVPIKIGDAPNNKFEGGPDWFELTNVRPACIGEEELTGFLKAYLNIPNKSYKRNGETITISNKSDAEAQLENVGVYFKGDVKELKSIISMQPKNKVKVLFGIRNTSDNKQYQDVCTQKFLKNSVNDYSNLDAFIKDRKNNGAYPNTEFEVVPLKEYNNVATSFEALSDSTPPAFGGGDWAFQPPI